MGLLDGLRVLDLTMWRPGPYATQLLAQLGAEVLKVEPPGGEPMRAFRGHFDVLNRHKGSVVIDLKADAARCLELAADADVFVEGYRPGVADRLGVGYEAVRAVNSRIVYCSISGYGASGPLASLPGHDVNYRAYAGTAPPDDGGTSSPSRTWPRRRWPPSRSWPRVTRARVSVSTWAWPTSWRTGRVPSPSPAVPSPGGRAGPCRDTASTRPGAAGGSASGSCRRTGCGRPPAGPWDSTTTPA